MVYQQQKQANFSELTSLSLALNCLLNKTEKSWGYFQVQKEEDFYSLVIPSLPSFKLYTNPKSIGYKGYWREGQEQFLPNIKDKNEKPDLYTRRKTKQVEVAHKSQKSSGTPQSKIFKKQVTFEVNYRYHHCPEVRHLNKIIAQFISDRIAADVTFSPTEEIMPLVLILESPG